MSKIKGLEDFLQSYIQNKEIKNGALSYSDYLKSRGNEYESTYRKQRLGAALSYKKALPNRGATLESLTSAGLKDSGYANHLASLAEKQYKTDLDIAEDKRRSDEAEAKSGYAKYLNEYDAEQTKLKERVTDSLIENGVLDASEGYNYAIESGLAPEAAAVAGERASTEVRRRLRLKVISEMFSRSISPDSAADYAIELGLSEDDANDIREIAKKYKENSGGFSDEYLEYLESLGNKTTVTYN